MSGFRSRPAVRLAAVAGRHHPRSTSRPATSPWARPIRAEAAGAVAIGAVPGGLSLCGGRGRGIHHGPRLGRPGLHLRERRHAWPKATASRWPVTRPCGGGCRSRHAAPGARCGRARSTITADARHRARRPSAPWRSRWRSAVGRCRPAPRRLERFPFVPADPARLAQDCYEAYNIQVVRPGCSGSARPAMRTPGHRRLGRPRFSTHALIVAAKAMDLLRTARAPTSSPTRMPGFATSEDHARANAHAADGVRWSVSRPRTRHQASGPCRC